jgi:hypothetical protein
MKNTLAENMLRFGAKNLTESSKQILEQLTKQTKAAGVSSNPNWPIVVKNGGTITGAYYIGLGTQLYLTSAVSVALDIFGTDQSILAITDLQPTNITDLDPNDRTNAWTQKVKPQGKPYPAAMYTIPSNQLDAIQYGFQSYQSAKVRVPATSEAIAYQISINYGTTALSDQTYSEQIDKIMKSFVNNKMLTSKWDQTAFSKLNSMLSKTKFANVAGVLEMSKYTVK